MPNRNYIKGKNKEQALAREYREKGCIAIRSAGSKGPIDVCVIDTQHKVIRLFQCKPDDFSESAKNKILNDLSSLNGLFEISFQII